MRLPCVKPATCHVSHGSRIHQYPQIRGVFWARRAARLTYNTRLLPSCSASRRALRGGNPLSLQRSLHGVQPGRFRTEVGVLESVSNHRSSPTLSSVTGKLSKFRVAMSCSSTDSREILHLHHPVIFLGPHGYIQLYSTCSRDQYKWSLLQSSKVNAVNTGQVGTINGGWMPMRALAKENTKREDGRLS